jgi:hypothetical protein
MDWIIRFTLGLPARSEDIAVLSRALPELRGRKLRLEQRRYFRLFHPEFDTNQEIFEALRRWVAAAEIAEEPERQDFRNCPSNNCPLRIEQSKTYDGDDPFIARLMVAAGGPNAKPPKDSFLDLVRRTHPENNLACEVILTDPYIYSDVSEDGNEGGFVNLVAYLEALHLSYSNSFTLRMTPSPKRGTLAAKDKLHRLLKGTFEKIQIKSHSNHLKFHDRFYVVRHQSGIIKGVFGPSLNGLTSDAIVLMGDIVDIQPVKKLEKWFG